MTLFSDELPIIFSIVFLLAFIFPIFMFARLAQKGGVENGIIKVASFYIVYLIGVSIASFNGVFDAIWLPPKIIVLTMIPLVIFLTGVIFYMKFCKEANKQLKLDDLVKIHIFRLIGSFFLIFLFYELIPKPLGLIAGIGDLITAISSIFVAKSIRNKKSYARKLTLTWNTFGLVDIIATSASAIILTKISIDTGSQGVEFLAQFPFCFIPAFAPATIIFLHLLTYRKILVKKYH